MQFDKYLKYPYRSFPLKGALFAILGASCLLANSDAQDVKPKAYWVFYTQKVSNEIEVASQRAWQRRLARSDISDFTWHDNSVTQDYIEQTIATGARVRTISRWLNAVSIDADMEAIERIVTLPFVSEIQPVSTYKMPIPKANDGITAFPGVIVALEYGQSYFQVAQLAIDSLHRLGLSGDSVLIGIMDTGFDTSHSVFAAMRADGRIVATHDFINGDDDVMDEWGPQRFHGTAVHSLIGAFLEDTLIGTAFGAEYLLAKTEIVSDEIQAEEDYWVAAAEWMEPQGVDIITSSVGYADEWYDISQLDGDTPVITRAADMAAELGVIVVNAAGNEGNTMWGRVIAPADGDSVIAVGAVTLAGEVLDFSSRGPTADGRIKPDFCALGAGDFVANYAGGYGYFSGTSFAAPLLAGGIALLLEGHPDWNFGDIISVLRRASSQATQPNNDYGWGITDFVSAFNRQPFRPRGLFELRIAPHPALDTVVFYMTVPDGGQVVLSVHDVSGAQVQEWKFSSIGPTTIIESWDGRNRAGKQIASGIYVCALKVAGETVREKMVYVRSR